MIRLIVRRTCFCLFILISFVDCALAGPIVGVIAKVEGKATIHGENRSRTAALYGYLYQGERLTVSPNASVTIYVPADGHTEQFAEGATTVEAMGFNPSGKVKKPQTKRAAKLMAGKVATLPENSVGGIVTFRGIPENRPIEPIPSAIVLDKEPIFRWSGPASQDYRLVVSRGARQVIWHTKTSGTEVTYQGRPLEPGVPYTWKVTQIGGGEVTSGTFIVATQAQRELAEDWMSFHEQEDVVLLSVAAFHLFHEGMIAQAIGVFERIVELEPENGEYHAALGHLYGRAGRLEDAQQQYQKAAQLGTVIDDAVDN